MIIAATVVALAIADRGSSTSSPKQATARAPLIAAWTCAGSPSDAGWTSQRNRGHLAVQKYFASKVKTTAR